MKYCGVEFIMRFMEKVQAKYARVLTLKVWVFRITSMFILYCALPAINDPIILEQELRLKSIEIRC